MMNYSVRLHTMTDGNRTVAEASLTNDFLPYVQITTGAGSAGREPGDKADKKVGEWLSLARALRSVAAHLERKANGRMRHLESVAAHRAEIAARKAVKKLREDAVQYNKYGQPLLNKNGYLQSGYAFVRQPEDNKYGEV